MYLMLSYISMKIETGSSLSRSVAKKQSTFLKNLLNFGRQRLKFVGWDTGSKADSPWSWNEYKIEHKGVQKGQTEIIWSVVDRALFCFFLFRVFSTKLRFHTFHAWSAVILSSSFSLIKCSLSISTIYQILFLHCLPLPLVLAFIRFERLNLWTKPYVSFKIQ